MLDAIVKLLLAIISLLNKPKVEPETIKPTSTKRITLEELYALLKDKFPTAEIYLSDRDYLLCHYDDIALFLAQDETNKMTYIAEERDCDDFSYRLMGQFSIPDWSDLCFGIIWSTTHAENVAITEDMKVVFVEPQNDQLSDTISGDIRFIMI